jgi:biotin operon repressor
VSAAGVGLFKALADPSRLRLLAALRERPLYPEVLAERLKLSPSTVSFHLKKLEAAGLVTSSREQYYVVYRPVEALLGRTLGELVRLDGAEEREQSGRERAYRRKVLETFFAYGRLRSIPVQRKKRRIVLEQLVESFELDRDYPESEVNEVLGEYHEDFCTLRRELIMEKLMTRAEGVYRRTERASAAAG